MLIYSILKLQGENIMAHKNLKSSKIQLFFFTFIPSIITYIAVAFMLIDFSWTQSAAFPVTIIAILWSLLGGFICAANKSLIIAIGSPSQPVINIEIGKDKITATSGMEYSSKQKGQLYANLFFAVIFAIPVASMGWLLFILFCKGKFLSGLYAMACDCDKADDIIYSQTGKIEDIAYLFYRMLDYTETYKNLGEKGGAQKMLDKAGKLLNIWQNLI